MLAERACHQTAFASKESSGTRGPLGCVNAGKRLGNAAAASSQSRRSPCTHAVTRSCNGCLRFQCQIARFSMHAHTQCNDALYSVYAIVRKDGMMQPGHKLC